MREFDVTPQEQGTECIYQSKCEFYKYGIWCNTCTQYTEFDYIESDE